MTGQRALGSPYAGLIRALRGTAVGATTIGLSLSGHTIAGGARPSPAVLLGLVLAAAAICTEMSSLEWTTRRLAGVLLVSQGGLHLAFSLSGHRHPAGSSGVMLGWHLAASVVALAILRYAETGLSGVVERTALRRRGRILEAFVAVPTRGLTTIGTGHAGRSTRIAELLLPVRAPPALS